MSNSNSQNFQPSDSIHSKTESQSNVKKRHRRMKSSGVKNSEFDGESSENLNNCSVFRSTTIIIFIKKIS